MTCTIDPRESPFQNSLTTTRHPYPPGGEPVSYSPTSPGGSGSPGPSILDDDFMAGIVDDEESDLRDIVMLYQVEERKAARQQQQRMIQVVASLGETPELTVGSERTRPEPLWLSSLPTEDICLSQGVVELRHSSGTGPRPHCAR